MRKERNKAIPAVYLLLKKGRKVLLMRRQNSGYYDGYYAFPAGHVEAGELPLEALIREVSEELGIKIDSKDVQLAHMMYRTKHDKTGDRADLFFETTKWSGKVTNTEPHKCDDVQWFSVDSLPANIMPHDKEALQNIRQGIAYSELGLTDIQRITNNKQ